MKQIKKNAPKIDISDFQLEAIENIAQTIQDAIGKAASEALTLALNDDESTSISFPIEWAPRSDGQGGKPIKDPLTIYLHIAFNSSIEPCVFRFTLRDALEGTLKDAKNGGPFGSIDEVSFGPGLAQLSAAFRTLADEIDAAIKTTA